MLISIILTVINVILPGIVLKTDTDIGFYISATITVISWIVTILFQVLYLKKDLLRYIVNVAVFSVKGCWKLGLAFGRLFIFVPVIGIIIGFVLSYVCAAAFAFYLGLACIAICIIGIITFPVITVLLHDKVGEQ